MTKEDLLKGGMNLFVVGLALCIPFGLVMAYWMNDVTWLWFCLPILIFLS